MDNQLIYIKQLIYQLKKDYGFPVDVYRIDSVDVDVKTGVKTSTRTKYKIRKAVVLPSMLARKFAYDLSYIAANKNFTYGAFYDINTRVFIVDKTDLPKNFNLVQDDYVMFEGKRYDIRQFEKLEHGFGYLITAKETIGQKPHQIITSNVTTAIVLTQNAQGVK